MGRRSGKPGYASAFGQALDALLTQRGLRQTELAAATDASPAYINRMMNGAKVSPEWADLVAGALNLPDEDRTKLHQAAAISWGYRLDLTKP